MSYKSKTTYVHDLKEIPKEPHWVIMTQRNIRIPGDERSRTNPGHGYPAHYETCFDYRYFTDEDEWLKEIEEEEKKSYPSYVAFKSSGAVEVTKKVSVKVNQI